MEKHITNRLTGINYTLVGDYYLPDLIPSESAHEIGRFGQLRYKHLKSNRRTLYTELLSSGKLNAHLHNIDVQAQVMFDELVKVFAEKQGITEQLKAEHQLEWVGGMNNIHNAAKEVVLSELIYN